MTLCIVLLPREYHIGDLENRRCTGVDIELDAECVILKHNLKTFECLD